MMKIKNFLVVVILVVFFNLVSVVGDDVVI